MRMHNPAHPGEIRGNVVEGSAVSSSLAKAQTLRKKEPPRKLLLFCLGILGPWAEFTKQPDPG